jgi:D-alanine-D-alanine ligase
MEKIARATFWALDCRDVARVDLRMDEEGRIYVLEVNPLPGLTPDYSDLVLIAKASGMEYDQLIAEIMQGGLRRMRDKRREERELEREREAKESKAAEVSKLDKDKPKRKPDNGNGNGGRQAAATAERAERTSDGTVKASVKRERSEPVAGRRDETDSDQIPTPSAVGNTTTH